MGDRILVWKVINVFVYKIQIILWYSKLFHYIIICFLLPKKSFSQNYTFCCKARIQHMTIFCCFDARKITSFLITNLICSNFKIYNTDRKRVRVDRGIWADAKREREKVVLDREIYSKAKEIVWVSQRMGKNELERGR